MNIFLKNIVDVWKKVSNINKIEFDNKPVYTEKYLKTKIKSYNQHNFHNNEIPKEGFQCICLSVILIDSVYRKDKNYYPQVFLEEWKYIAKEKKTSKFINYDNSDR